MGGSSNGLEMLAEEQAKQIKDGWGQKHLSVTQSSRALGWLPEPAC